MEILKRLKWFFVALFLIFLDQIIKHNVHEYMINDNVGITITYNTGAGFSILTGNNLLLLIIGLIFVIFIGYLAYREKDKLPYVLILSGAIGNIIDRIFLGHVIDYIKIYWWPVFNLADSLIVVGALILVYHLVFSKPSK